MQKATNNWQCRWASSLGRLESTHEEVWGTRPYENDEAPTVFFGLYGLPDFYALWRHKGKRAILWAGTDITHFKNGYWLEDGGAIKVSPKPLAKWINKHCENYCENVVEYKALLDLGIESKIAPSFLGNIDDFELSFTPSRNPKVYSSVSGDNFEMYGWNEIEGLVLAHPDIEFHLYGNTKEWKTKRENVIVHGRVPKEVMNAEIKEMQGALRLAPFDGFSEIIAKSILWGQYPVSVIPYEHMLDPQHLKILKDMEKPNTVGRDHYRKILNTYPWNVKKH